MKALVGSEVIEDGINPVFIEALDDGKIGLRIGTAPRRCCRCAVVTEEDLPLPWPYLHVARDPDDQRNAKSKK